MKHAYLLFFILLFSACQSVHNEAKVPKTKTPKHIRLAELGKMEAEMLRDPKTGEIPMEKLYDIRKEIIKEQSTSLRDDVQWDQRGPRDVGGRTRAILVDSRDPTGNSLLIGSVSGGLWRVDNALSEPIWTRIESYLGSPAVSSIVQDPNDPNTLYVGTGEGWFNSDAYRGDGIYKSVDNGVTWGRLPGTLTYRYVQKLLINAQGNIFACTRSQGVVMSEDGGQTWTQVLSNSNQGFSNRAADILETSDGKLFASIGIFQFDGVYRSVNGGLEWEFLDLGPGVNTFERIEISAAPSDPDVLYALLQDEESNGVGYILKTEDGGDTWAQRTVPSALGMDNFARNQAWYDLISAVDPNDPNTLIIGGVDLHKSTDGGFTWQQISQWFGGGGIEFVHADQHELIFLNNDSNQLLNSNDGGLWYTNEATSFSPNFEDLSDGYISTQFYSCAIHPDEGVNYFMGGTQDNGTDLVNSPGVGRVIEITGGDGGYSHIDQDNPLIQISAFQDGIYNITLDGWNSRESVNPGGDPYFINPSAYDDVNNVLFAGYDSAQIVRIDVFTLDATVLDLVGVGNDRISALKTYPSTDNTLFVGTNNGRIFKVTKSLQATPDVEFLFNGGGFTRSIDVDPNNSDRIFVTFSNFGIENTRLTEDGGETWRAFDGNLPNVPVRWGIFNPVNQSELIIATEVGIWTTNISTEPIGVTWTNISGDIGPIRVNMLQYRNSDLTMLAASHGRGLWTTDLFVDPNIQWSTPTLTVPEGIETAISSCGGSVVYNVPIILNQIVEEDITGSIIINTESTAIPGLDYDIESDQFTIAAGEVSDTIQIAVYNDLVVDGEKVIILDIESDFNVSNERIDIVINEDDQDFSNGGLIRNIVTPSPGGATSLFPFNGSFEDARTQIFYSKTFFEDNDISQGEIYSLGFVITAKGSSLPYNNFTIKIKNANGLSQGTFETFDVDEIYFNGNFTTSIGFNTIELSRPFIYDGIEGILIEICYDNEAWSDNDVVLNTLAEGSAMISSSADNSVGCNLDVPSNSFTDRVPLLTVETRAPSELLTNTDITLSSDMEAGESAFYQYFGSLLVQIDGSDANVSDCVLAELASDSVTTEAIKIDNYEIQPRIFYLENEDNGNEYNVSFWTRPLTEDVDMQMFQVAYLEDFTGDLSTIPDNISGLIDLTSVETIDELWVVDFPYQGDGYYLLAKIFSSTEDLIEDNFQYDQIRYFDISGRLINHKDDLPLGIYIKSYFYEGIPVQSEKVLLSN
ncbi:MAG: hypothetical protein AAGA77_10015 [Bacteroidota bacterium]